MDFSIIAIGDELLLGQVTDTNSGFIARTLTPEGWHLSQVYTIGDDAAQIKESILQAMASTPLVITTGGLGPTKDDITKTVLLEIFGGELYRDETVTENIRRVFSLRGLQMNPLTADQALVPTSCRVIQNRYGTAPILWFERDGRALISMPGVPFETEGMIKGEVSEAIREHFHADIHRAHRTIIASGITESALAGKLSVFEDTLPEYAHLAYLPNPGYIRLRLDIIGNTRNEAETHADSLCRRLREEIDDNLLHTGDATPAEIALERVRAAGMTLVTAESCTGGNIAHRITAIAGASDVYLGSVISYANTIKADVLGVQESNLMDYGAVSEPVVRQMAEGVCRRLGATCSIATSGIAGPGGGTPDKPVGTVWIAVHTPAGTVSRLVHLPGDRARVIDRATTEALLLLINQLKPV